MVLVTGHISLVTSWITMCGRVDDIQRSPARANCRAWRTRQSNEIDSVDVSVLKLGPGANSPSSSARSLFATLEQPRRFHPIRPGRECRRRTAPAQRLDLLKERRIGAQRREFLEEQREIAPFAENV